MARYQNIRQKKSLGQVFLTTEWPLDRMLEKLRAWGAKRVLEIGPGGGVLTRKLVSDAYQVTAIEKDDRFAERMVDWGASQPSEVPGRLEVINEDILKYDIGQWIAAGKAAGEKLAVVGNIPYNISSPIVMMLLPVLGELTGCMLMTQLEFAKRLAAMPGTKDYGSLTVFAQLRADLKLEFSVPRKCFKPVPKVDSAVVTFTHRREQIEQSLLDRAEKITRAAFNQRRKKLRNSISKFLNEELEASCPIDLTRRADSLGPREFIQLGKHFVSLDDENS